MYTQIMTFFSQTAEVAEVLKIMARLSPRIWNLPNFVAIPQIPLQDSICIHRAPLHAKEMLMERCVLHERCELAPPDERERHLERSWT